MAVEIMTTRAFLEGLAKYNLQGDDEAKRVALIKGLDAKNEKRKNTPNKKQKENEPVKAEILAFLEDKGAVLGTEIAKALGLTTQKVTGVARLLVNEGALVTEKVKVKGKGEQVAYKVADADEVEAE
jgi:Predicted transcriptional regulator